MSSSPTLRRLSATLAAVAVAALALSACSGSSSPASSESAGGASADYGDISVQYSWIKNEEFAGEFYAYDNGYYDEAGFSKVTGVAGPDTGVAKLLSGSVQVALTDAASVGAAVAEQDAPLKIIATTFQKNPSRSCR
jgi:ABC-type nitrate/sulfonate/bicarbonate transport system substrate-binding protein